MKAIRVFAVVAIFVAATRVSAQQPTAEQAQKEHEWLEKFVGEWETAASSEAAPGQPAVHSKGSMTSRMLGEFWVVSELEFDMMGMKISALQTIGYDAKTKKYVGTWVDSMFNHMWKYEGTVDSTGAILTLEADGPSFDDPEKTWRRPQTCGHST